MRVNNMLMKFTDGDKLESNKLAHKADKLFWWYTSKKKNDFYLKKAG